MALSAMLSRPAAIRSRRLVSLAAGIVAAVLLGAALGALFDLRQEMVDQREYAHRGEKLDFTVIDFLAGQGVLLAPATVNGWTKTLHIGWTRMEVAPDSSHTPAASARTTSWRTTASGAARAET